VLPVLPHGQQGHCPCTHAAYAADFNKKAPIFDRAKFKDDPVKGRALGAAAPQRLR
jgi:hypothetical protein